MQHFVRKTQKNFQNTGQECRELRDVFYTRLVRKIEPFIILSDENGSLIYARFLSEFYLLYLKYHMLSPELKLVTHF